MMKTSYQITIPKPCHEDWERMTVVDRGRFCNSCRKKVFDFTHSSDREIIAALKKDNLCGRFRESQLDRELQEPKTKSSLWIAAATGIIGFLGLGNHVSRAQEKPAVARLIGQPLEEVEEQQLVKGEVYGDTIAFRSIKGTVSDASGPLPGAVVVNKRSRDTVRTDVDGVFSMSAQKGDELSFSFIGMFETAEVIDDRAYYTIKMKENGSLGQIVLGLGDVYVRRSFFGQLFHKIGRVFR